MASADNPILNSPYEEPTRHYATDAQGNLNYRDVRPGRRVFTADVPQVPIGQSDQGSIFDLNDFPSQYGEHLINTLRDELRSWRQAGYRGVSSRVTRDEVKARSVADIAYWMVDDDYDGSSFMVRQVFFCGGDRDEFDKWKRGLSDVAKTRTRRKLENTLKIEIDDEAFDRLYGFVSHPIPFRAGRRVAVRVVSQFGEESTKVLQP